MVAAVHSV